tara:strand:+ start:969 stop:1796 length:828 start_codon:yes stop_codon:yes gene_type:complete
MSELFGKDMSQHVMKNNIMKDDFGWEIPYELVPIPSNGIIYHPDSSLYCLESVKIKAMTAREEDILSSPALIKEGSVITHLIKSCVVGADIDPDLMISGDRNALMISIRMTGYGPNYPYKATCVQCKHRGEYSASLDRLGIKRLEIKPIEQGKNEFVYELPVTKKQIKFKFLTEADDKNKKATEKFMSSHTSGKVENKITSFLENSIVEIDGIRDKNKIKHFVMHMPAFDSKALRKFINKNEPGIDMSQKFECVECDHVNDTKLPVNSEFFWPST